MELYGAGKPVPAPSLSVFRKPVLVSGRQGRYVLQYSNYTSLNSCTNTPILLVYLQGTEKHSVQCSTVCTVYFPVKPSLHCIVFCTGVRCVQCIVQKSLSMQCRVLCTAVQCVQCIVQ